MPFALKNAGDSGSRASLPSPAGESASLAPAAAAGAAVFHVAPMAKAVAGTSPISAITRHQPSVVLVSYRAPIAYLRVGGEPRAVS